MKRTLIAVGLISVAASLIGCTKPSSQSVKQSAVADSTQTAGVPSVALVPVSQTSADPKAAAISEALSFLNRHFVISDNSAGRLEPTGFRADESHIIFEFDYSGPSKPKNHFVESALATDLDPDSVRYFAGWLHVDCKSQKNCVSQTDSGAKNELPIGPVDESYSDKAKQYLRQILLMQLGQSPEAATKPLVDSHKGEQFWGWNCKNLEPLKAGRTASVELIGPVMAHRQESMAVTVWLDDPQEMAWRSALYRSRYLAGPEKGKFMEDYWESHFTNGAREATLNLSKGEVLCPSCSDDYEGWKFNLNAKVPRQDDPTQLDEFLVAGTCNEKWLKSTGKSSPVVQPKDEAQQ